MTRGRSARPISAALWPCLLLTWTACSAAPGSDPETAEAGFTTVVSEPDVETVQAAPEDPSPNLVAEIDAEGAWGADDDAARRPTMPLDLGHFCPFEYGCGLNGHWFVIDSLPVYSSRGDLASQASHVSAGTCVVATAAYMMVQEPGIVVLSEPVEIPSGDTPYDRSLQRMLGDFEGMQAGDTLYVLAIGAEAMATVWVNGRQVSTEPFWSYRDELSQPTTTWWVQLGAEEPSWLAFTGSNVRGVDIGNIDGERLVPPPECPTG